MTQSKAKVSIGLPVYNGENYLAEAIESVLAQTYENFELIISDNASTDGTEAICRAYAAKDGRITYIRNPQNLGAAPNYNQTFHAASGSYFKWIAHDDRCAPEFLARSVEILDNEPNVVICYSQTVLIDEHGGVLEYYSDDLHLRSPKPYERFHKLVNTPGWCNPIFGLMRSSVLARTPLIANYPRSDRNLLAELTLYGEFHELPDFLLYRRVHPQISTEVYNEEKDLAVWFDTRNKNRLVLPRWRRYSDYLQMARRAPISMTDRLRVVGFLSKNVLSLDKLRSLGSDLLVGVRTGLGSRQEPSDPQK